MCEHKEIQCTWCGQYIHYHTLEKHLGEECPSRPQPCPHCRESIPLQQVKVAYAADYRPIRIIDHLPTDYRP